MYSLKQWLDLTGIDSPTRGWDGDIFCTESNAELTYHTNDTQGFLACYSFTLVKQGWVEFRYSGRTIRLCPNDLYIYSPGLSINILDASSDYRSICLMVDEQATLEMPSVRDLANMAYHPVVQQILFPPQGYVAPNLSQHKPNCRTIKPNFQS